MIKNKTNQSPTRDYTSISPSAYSLVLVKGLTNIPYMRRAAEEMMRPETYTPDLDKNDFSFWARVVHFESRYWSVDQLLADIPSKNILELSSGFSFRGLAWVQKSGFHYIDTDLPEVINDKIRMFPLLEANDPSHGSKLETIPLNALAQEQVTEVVSHFSPNEPVVIVNEGLLMYLSRAEKEKLFRIIHGVLTARGGCWITADIYISRGARNQPLERSDNWEKFFDQHKVNEQMFDSFEDAEKLFNDAGFVIDRQAESDYTQVTALVPMIKSATKEQLDMIKNSGRIRATWRLTVK
jgi:O-methyltransferase involved in polyketide biosynthesis